MKKEKNINTPQLRIVGNIMAWKDSVLQLSNVSSISTVPLDLIPFPSWVLLILLAGIYIFIIFGVGIGDFMISWVASIVLSVITIAIICYWYQKNENLKTQKNLIILMNSGVTFSFLFNDQKFLNEVFAVLSSIIAEGGKEERHVKINIKNSTISGNAKILNDMLVS